MIFNQPHLIAAFSRGRQNMSLGQGPQERSLENRREFLSGLGIDCRKLTCAKQAHASRTHIVREQDKGKGALSADTAIAESDALIIAERNLPIAIFTADCLPVFLYDPLTPAIGLVHAGRRSSAENISAKTVRLMQENFHTDPASLKAGLGPAIRACCYEVGKEFSASFKHALEKRDGRYYLDLAGLNKEQLLAAGLASDNITDCGLCTCCQSDEFFSYRREGSSCGRMISVMMLSGPVLPRVDKIPDCGTQKSND